jgi:hypothetical protein
MQVALFDCPFGEMVPNPALSAFKASLRQRGIQAKVIYLKHELHQIVGDGAYYLHKKGAITWIAYRKAFGKVPVNAELAEGLDISLYHAFLRKTFEAFVENVAKRDWSECQLFAFSVNLDSQTFPVLAFVRELKQRYPDVPVVLGGIEMFLESGIEYLRKIENLDVVFLRDAGCTFPVFVQKYIESGDLEGALEEIDGVAYRSGGGVTIRLPSSMSEDVNLAPAPDFDDWIEVTNDTSRRMAYPLQFATGCWYGIKNSCSFCGEAKIRNYCYSCRTPENALAYLRDIVTRYPQIQSFDLVDPLLPRDYIRTVMKPWIEQRPHKNNFTMCLTPTHTKEEVRILKEFGAASVVAGIESLHPQSLRLMRKFHRVYQSIAFLKWCKHYKIFCCWMMLGMMPGEDPAWYEEQKDLIRKLLHFNPPLCTNPLAIHRSNSYFRPDLKPGNSPLCYPTFLDETKISYFWHDEPNLDAKLPFNEFSKWVDDEWMLNSLDREFHSKMIMELPNRRRLELKGHKVLDSRNWRENVEIPLTDEERNVLIASDSPARVSELKRRFGDIAATLEALDTKGLIYREGGICLSLLEALSEEVLCELQS